MVRVSGKIKRLLVDAGLVSEEAWSSARDKGGNVIETLLSSGALEENALLEAVGRAASVAPTWRPSSSGCSPTLRSATTSRLKISGK